MGLFNEAIFDKIGNAGDWLGIFIEKLSNFGVDKINIPIFNNKWYLFVRIIIWMAFVLLGGSVFYKYFIEYGRIKVQLRFRSVGGQIYEIKHDRARVGTDKAGKRKIIFLKFRKLNMPPVPKQEYKYKIGKQDYYVFEVTNNNDCYPVELSSVIDPQKKLIFDRVVPDERTAWLMNERKVLEEKYKNKNWMEKYGNYVIPTMAMAMATLILYFAIQSIEGGMNNLAQQFGQIAQNCIGG